MTSQDVRGWARECRLELEEEAVEAFVMECNQELVRTQRRREVMASAAFKKIKAVTKQVRDRLTALKTALDNAEVAVRGWDPTYQDYVASEIDAFRAHLILPPIFHATTGPGKPATIGDKFAAVLYRIVRVGLLSGSPLRGGRNDKGIELVAQAVAAVRASEDVVDVESVWAAIKRGDPGAFSKPDLGPQERAERQARERARARARARADAYAAALADLEAEFPVPDLPPQDPEQ